MDTRLIKPIRALPKPLLLKDHLLDDMSSCSSNGFKSFPRRQCCTTVRFLHETTSSFDRRNKLQHHQKTYVSFTKPPAKSALSALITAVKRLPFGGAKSPEQKKKSKINSFLPRSFSKRMFRKGSFWKRKPERKEISIERWKSFRQLLMEDSQPSDRSNGTITTTDDSKSYSWSGSDFTASDGGNSSSEVNLNLPDKKNDAVQMSGEKVVKVTNDDVSAESTTSSDGSSITNSSNETKKQWRSDQEKEEQLSPVCVLDCPFEEEEEDDDEDEVSSPFQHRLARMEGTRKKLLKKIQRFECLAKLEPVNLTRRFAPQPGSDDESSDSPLPHSSSSIDEEQEEEEDEDEDEEEEKAIELLDQVKAKMPSYGLKLKADNLMLDFFRESISIDLHCTNLEKQRDESSLYEELVEIAEDWLNGRKPRELFKEWEVEKNRQAYVEDMEKGGEWKILDQEKEEVVLELENEVFDAMLNEMLLDIIC